MLPNKLDITLALKAIALANNATAAEKRIAAAVLDHFNRKTGRCDPSYETIAAILSINVRTVGRGITKFAKINFFKVIIHGGVRQCNSYQPNWPLFRTIETEWRRRRREYANRFKAPEMSCSTRQGCPPGEGQIALQTYSNNILPLTSSANEVLQNVPQVESGLPSNGLGVFAARIEKRLGRPIYHSWFRNVGLVEATDGTVILSANSEQIKNRIEQWYGIDILECFEPEYENIVRVDVIVRKPDS
jgi:DnaA N-terminal domain